MALTFNWSYNPSGLGDALYRKNQDEQARADQQQKEFNNVIGELAKGQKDYQDRKARQTRYDDSKKHYEEVAKGVIVPEGWTKGVDGDAFFSPDGSQFVTTEDILNGNAPEGFKAYTADEVKNAKKWLGYFNNPVFSELNTNAIKTGNFNDVTNFINSEEQRALQREEANKVGTGSTGSTENKQKNALAKYNKMIGEIANIGALGKPTSGDYDGNNLNEMDDIIAELEDAGLKLQAEDLKAKKKEYIDNAKGAGKTEASKAWDGKFNTLLGQIQSSVEKKEYGKRQGYEAEIKNLANEDGADEIKVQTLRDWNAKLDKMKGNADQRAKNKKAEKTAQEKADQHALD